MSSNPIETAVDVIEYLVKETDWGRKTTSREMLCLVYGECRELGEGLLKMDAGNVIEEVADINMMLVYFCCKLPNPDVNAIRQLLEEAAACADRQREENACRGCGIQEEYHEILMDYSSLIHLYEAGSGRISELRDMIFSIAVSSLRLAVIKNNGKRNTVKKVFETISEKLHVRYAPYFDKQGAAFVSDEAVWTAGKNREKDMPYFYCGNRECEEYGRFGKLHAVRDGRKMRCRSCGREIDRSSLFLPDRDSRSRRNLFEELEKGLLSYGKGDTMMIALYTLHHVKDCIDIFSELILNGFPLNAFVGYFSDSCRIPSEITKSFLGKCFYRTFTCGDTDGKQAERAKAVRRFMNRNPAGFLKLAEDFGLSKAEILEMISTASDVLRGSCPVCNTWYQSSNEIIINLYGKRHSFFQILLILQERMASEKQAAVIRITGTGQNRKWLDYQNILNDLFADEENGIQEIRIDNGNNQK